VLALLMAAEMPSQGNVHSSSCPGAVGCRPMAKIKKPGDSNTPRGSSGGPPGKKQRSKARKSSKGRK